MTMKKKTTLRARSNLPVQGVPVKFECIAAIEPDIEKYFYTEGYNSALEDVENYICSWLEGSTYEYAMDKIIELREDSQCPA